MGFTNYWVFCTYSFLRQIIVSHSSSIYLFLIFLPFFYPFCSSLISVMVFVHSSILYLFLLHVSLACFFSYLFPFFWYLPRFPSFLSFLKSLLLSFLCVPPPFFQCVFYLFFIYLIHSFDLPFVLQNKIIINFYISCLKESKRLRTQEKCETFTWTLCTESVIRSMFVLCCVIKLPDLCWQVYSARLSCFVDSSDIS